MMFGRNAWTCAMNVLSAGIFSAPMAAEIANRKMNQNATLPIRRAGLAPGLTFSTYLPASLECRVRSSPTFSSSRATMPLTTLAMT